MFVKMLGTESLVFLSTVIFCIIYLRLLTNLLMVQYDKKSAWQQLFLSLGNGIVCTVIEHMANGRSNLAIISLITLVLSIGMYGMTRKKDGFYLYFHTYWLTSLQLQTSYLFSCAVVNLFISHLWITGSRNHRFAVYSVTLLLGTINFSLQLKVPKKVITIMSNIMIKRANTYLVGIYTIASTSILAVSGSLVSKMLYEEVDYEVKIIMYPDLILKNFLILGGCLLIIVYLVQNEITARENHELNNKLKAEKEFREKFHSNALLSYCANITKDCFVKEKSEFLLPEANGYRESIMDFIVETLHPEDMERLAGLINEEYYEKQIEKQPDYSIKIRMAPKAILALTNQRLTEEDRKQLKSNREWIWVELHITIIREEETNDILTYISLTNIDNEMTEKEQLADAAIRDSLTGLLNRSGLEQLLKAHLLSVPNGGTLFMIDMDYFKSVNDKLGHPVGDKVLKDAANILRSIFREEDFVCRLGGDEFCVFAKNLENKELVIERAKELEKQGRRCYTSSKGDITVNVSFSIGVVIIKNGNKISYEELYEQADQVLYQAKERGRNTYVLKGEEQ